MIRRLVVAAVLAVLTCLVGAGTASAHDELIGSTPEDGAVLASAPESVVVEFFEPVAMADPSLVLRDDQDDVIENLDLQVDERTVSGVLPADLSEGTYLVQWQITSEDGHAEKGVVRFAIGQPSTSMDYSGDQSSATSWALSIGTVALIVVAVAVVLGAVVIVLLVRRRSARDGTS